MAWKANRLTKPWRPFGNEAIYQLPHGDYAITGDRMPYMQCSTLGLDEAPNETTVRLPGALIDELVAGYLAARAVPRPWLLMKWVSKLKALTERGQ